jgi:hypothetical protein
VIHIFFSYIPSFIAWFALWLGAGENINTTRTPVRDLAFISCSVDEGTSQFLITGA